MFEPADSKEHDRGNRGEDVPDYCINCNRPFADHYNGACPKDEIEIRRDEEFAAKERMLMIIAPVSAHAGPLIPNPERCEMNETYRSVICDVSCEHNHRTRDAAELSPARRKS